MKANPGKVLKESSIRLVRNPGEIITPKRVEYERLSQEAEAQRQERQKANYEDNLRRYEQEFSKAIQAEYPLSDHLREGLRNFQQSLEIKNEDVARIEQPILSLREIEYQQQIANQQGVEKQKQQEAKRLRQQKEAVHRQNIREYEQRFLKAIQAEYPLSEPALESLKQFRQSLELSEDEVVQITTPFKSLQQYPGLKHVKRIEQPIFQQAEASFRERLKQPVRQQAPIKQYSVAPFLSNLLISHKYGLFTLLLIGAMSIGYMLVPRVNFQALRSIVEERAEERANASKYAARYVENINHAQQQYFSRKGEFSSTFQDLDLKSEDITATVNLYYRLRLTLEVGDVSNVRVAAQPHFESLKSYAGAVFALQKGTSTTTLAIVCETNEPSATPPAIPQPSKTAPSKIQCPAGSHEIVGSKGSMAPLR